MHFILESAPENKVFRFFLGLIFDYAGDHRAAASHFDWVSAGSGFERALLDAWEYLKLASIKPPLIIGSSIQSFQLGINSANSTGLVMEFGVRHGTSIRQITSLVGAQEIHGFDSFEGLPEDWWNMPRGSYSTKGVIPDVPENVILHKGWFEDSIPDFLEQYSEPVRFMNIDCDIYSSTKTILELFAHRIIPGTVMVFDEYIGNEGWREDEFKAFKEAVFKHGWEYEHLGFSFCTKQVVVRIVQVNKQLDYPGNAIPDQHVESERPIAHRETGRSKVDTFLAKASHHARQADWVEVEVWLRRALDVKPDYADAHYNLGIALQNLGRLDEAEASYRWALQIRPSYAEAHNNLGAVLQELGRLDEAEVSCRRALEIKPDSAKTHNNLGITLQKLGWLDEAEASYRQALTINPDYAEAHGNLCILLQELGRLDEAEASYRCALGITAGSISKVSQLISCNYAAFLGKRGLLRESVSCYQQAFSERVGWHHAADKDLSSGLAHAYVELTNKCNFHCDFCPSDSQQRMQGFMSFWLICQLYDEFAEKNLVKQVNLHLMGEPTLHPNLVEVLDYAASKRIKTDLVTNGSTLNAKTVPRILDALYGTLAVSLQTPTRESFKHRGDTGLDWDRYIENIRLLVRDHLNRVALKQPSRNTLELRVMITKDTKLSANIIESLDDIRCVMHEWYAFVADVEIEFELPHFNRKELPEGIFAKLATQANIAFQLQQGLKLVFWQGFTFANSMLSREYSLEYEGAAKFCNHPFIDVAVLANGDVTLCCLDYDGKLAVGNMKDNTIEAILNGKPTMDLRSAMLGHRPLPSFCQQCQAKVILIPAAKQNTSAG